METACKPFLQVIVFGLSEEVVNIKQKDYRAA